MRFFPDMKSRSFVILAFGFGTLIVLIAILGFGAIRRARAIYSEMESTQKTYLEAESFRRDKAQDRDEHDQRPEAERENDKRARLHVREIGRAHV